MLTLSRGVQPCTHANSTLCSMRVPGLFNACSWLVPLLTDLFLACSACYWLIPLVPCFSNVVSRVQVGFPVKNYASLGLFKVNNIVSFDHQNETQNKEMCRERRGREGRNAVA